MTLILEILMWISIAVLVYVYLGYPLVITMLALMKQHKPGSGDPSFKPMVSIIIPARNEEKVIAEKIENTLRLDYPREKIEIIVISDNSRDRTDKIVKGFESKGVRLISLAERHGKTWAQNIAVEHARGEVIIFSDANALYVPQAIKLITQHFGDPAVGCVSGELHYTNPENSAVGYEEDLYWRWEKFIKRQEFVAGNILGANGSIYAVRKSDFVPLEKNIISDFIEPLMIAANGKKVIYEPQAKSFEKASLSFSEELARKRRIISRSLYSLLAHNGLLNPFRHSTLFLELISHKLLRWFSPIFAIIILFASAALALNGNYELFFLAQVAFYALGGLGFTLKNRKGWPKWIFTPYYFALISYASFFAIVDFAKGKNKVVWEPIRS